MYTVVTQNIHSMMNLALTNMIRLKNPIFRGINLLPSCTNMTPPYRVTRLDSISRPSIELSIFKNYQDLIWCVFWMAWAWAVMLRRKIRRKHQIRLSTSLNHLGWIRVMIRELIFLMYCTVPNNIFHALFLGIEARNTLIQMDCLNHFCFCIRS